MATPKRGHCSNRDVVNVENRLFSPAYDDEGDPGSAWYEFFDSDAMCFLRMCSHEDYNAWAKATDQYINGTGSQQLTGHYNKILNRAKAVYGGAAFPLDLSDKFKKVQDHINEWNDAGYKANKTIGDDFLHPLRVYWEGQVREIINYYDEAACLFDSLDEIAVKDLKQPSIAQGGPVRSVEDVPGGYLGGSGGPGGKKKPSGLGMAVGLFAIGAAGYFGYKILTE